MKTIAIILIIVIITLVMISDYIILKAITAVCIAGYGIFWFFTTFVNEVVMKKKK